MAVLDEAPPVLVDEDGVRLELVDPAAPPDLPVIKSESGFADDYEGKIALARTCLRALPEDKRRSLVAIEVGLTGRVGLELRDNPVKVFVAPEQAASGLDYLGSRLADWQARFGPLDSVDLTVPDRAYLAPSQAPAAAGRPGAAKEVL